MKLLLDTHVFIWWANEPDRLSSTALSACQDSDNTLALSVASVWEMQIKMQLGKLKLNNALGALIKEQQQVNGLQVITVELDHVLGLEYLPLHHKDPFDRLLVAQANLGGFTLVSADQALSTYPVQLLW